MIYREFPITNTATIYYQYNVAPDKSVTKSAQASVTSTQVKHYDFVTHKTSHLCACIPINYKNPHNILEFTQQIIPYQTIVKKGLGFYNVLFTVFSLYTCITYFNPWINDYDIYYLKQDYRLAWRIPKNYHQCDVEYSILKNSLYPINPCSLKSHTRLLLTILFPHNNSFYQP